jgi:FKBP-type peptidyl-prolyl cis-trans isomerase
MPALPRVCGCLFLTLSLAACGRTGAVRPSRRPPVSGAPADLPPSMNGAAWATPAPVDVSAPPADADRGDGGVARKILARGEGTIHPTLTSYVDLRYAGWERDGNQFEGTPTNAEPGRYDLKELAPGLGGEVEHMVAGERRRLWVPSALAYGKRANFTNAPKGDVTYEVELVRVIPRPPVPADLQSAPKGAKTTKSGLVYLVLKKGSGKTHPTDQTRANVVFSAWTPDGRMFECSLASGDVAPVALKRLPAGWREAMLRMVEGDKWRLWLPGKLAFGELQHGEEAPPFAAPRGPVVFDVELVKILQ